MRPGPEPLAPDQIRHLADRDTSRELEAGIGEHHHGRKDPGGHCDARDQHERENRHREPLTKAARHHIERA